MKELCSVFSQEIPDSLLNELVEATRTGFFRTAIASQIEKESLLWGELLIRVGLRDDRIMAKDGSFLGRLLLLLSKRHRTTSQDRWAIAAVIEYFAVGMTLLKAEQNERIGYSSDQRYLLNNDPKGLDFLLWWHDYRKDKIEKQQVGEAEKQAAIIGLESGCLRFEMLYSALIDRMNKVTADSGFPQSTA